jgi:hypothetical protein
MSLPRIAWVAALGAALLVAGPGCSNDDKRDQFYGTDVGANWVPPDATVREDAAPDGGRARDGGEAGVDGGAADGGVEDGAPSADAPASDTL